MKKFNLFLLAAVVAVSSVFTGCSSDEDAVGPALTVTASSETIEPGDEVTFTFRADAGDANLDFFTIKKNTDFATDVNDKVWTGEDEGVNTGKIPSAQDETYQGTATFKLLTAGTYEFTLKVTDKDGLTATETKTITVSEGTPAGEISSYTAKLLGGQDNAAGSYFASIDGSVYKTSELTATNKPQLDITYGVIGGTSTIMSASVRGTLGFTAIAGATETKYLTVTDVDFATVTFEQLGALVLSSATTDVDVSLNDVVAFKNAAGKVGVFKVTALTTGQAGSITIDVKVQK